MTNVEAIDPTTCPAWESLIDICAQSSTTTIRDLFALNPDRPADFTLEAAGIYADFSRQRVSQQALDGLLMLAEQTRVLALRDDMFEGGLINTTEGRAVLHTALRAPVEQSIVVDGKNVIGEVHQVLKRMGAFSDAVRSGSWTGATGKRITDVVNIGIGGSDLGPVMTYRAMQEYRDRSITCHFISNVDPSDAGEILLNLNPETTLFIVASKTFSTLETMTNAAFGRNWLVSALGDDAVAKHFVAVSTNAEAVAKFGIDVENMFGFWDWVGGRYSLESAIGLSTMVAIGRNNFHDLIQGFRAMDEHFKTTPLAQNLPILVGLLAIWNRNFLELPTTAVLPYSQLLSRFPAYLQQLTMESNGKGVRRDGTKVTYDTGAIFWGEPGTNGQHSFYQMLHQGTGDVACDVIVVAQNAQGNEDQQDILVANALAQASVLAFGRTVEEVVADGTGPELVAHKVMPGNRPTTVLMMQKLDPFTLGALVALYEHSVFVQGAVWGINSFDQWGVELGKKVALGILSDLRSKTSKDSQLDPASVADIDKYLSLKESK